LVVVGGVIPAQDYQYLFDAGAVAVLTWTKISEAAIKILENKNRRIQRKQLE
jgi:methylmalonyl-CoA mutase